MVMGPILNRFTFEYYCEITHWEARFVNQLYYGLSEGFVWPKFGQDGTRLMHIDSENINRAYRGSYINLNIGCH